MGKTITIELADEVYEAVRRISDRDGTPIESLALQWFTSHGPRRVLQRSVEELRRARARDCSSSQAAKQEAIRRAQTTRGLMRTWRAASKTDGQALLFDDAVSFFLMWSAGIREALTTDMILSKRGLFAC